MDAVAVEEENKIIEKALSILRKRCKKIDSGSIESALDIVNYIRLNFHDDPKHETFRIFYLDAQFRLITDEVLYRGTVDALNVHPRVVINGIIKNGAYAVILAHNHPSGEAEASIADIDFTKEMSNILEKIDVLLLDHIIVTEESYYSFKMNGGL